MEFSEFVGCFENVLGEIKTRTVKILFLNCFNYNSDENVVEYDAIENLNDKTIRNYLNGQATIKSAVKKFKKKQDMDQFENFLRGLNIEQEKTLIRNFNKYTNVEEFNFHEKITNVFRDIIDKDTEKSKRTTGNKNHSKKLSSDKIYKLQENIKQQEIEIAKLQENNKQQIKRINYIRNHSFSKNSVSGIIKTLAVIIFSLIVLIMDLPPEAKAIALAVLLVFSIAFIFVPFFNKATKNTAKQIVENSIKKTENNNIDTKKTDSQNNNEENISDSN